MYLLKTEVEEIRTFLSACIGKGYDFTIDGIGNLIENERDVESTISSIKKSSYKAQRYRLNQARTQISKVT